MSVKTHLSVPIGERKTDNFLLRLSKQSQEKISAVSAQTSANDGHAMPFNNGFQKPLKPLYTSATAHKALKPTKPAFLSNRSDTLDQNGTISDHSSSTLTVSPNTLLKASVKATLVPKPPSKPQKLSLSACLDTIPALQPSQPKKPKAFYTESQQLENIKIELPTYVARKDIAKITPESNFGRDLEAESSESTKMASISNRGPPKPPKIPLKPAPESKLGSKNSTTAALASQPVTPSKVAPLKPLKPKTLTPPRNQGTNVNGNTLSHIEAHSSYKPRFKPIVLNKPALPARPSTISQNKVCGQAVAFLPLQKTLSIHSGSSLISKKDSSLFSKPVLSAKPPSLSQPSALAQTKLSPVDNSTSSLTERSTALPDFKAALASVIRAQTEPQFPKKAVPGNVIRAQTVAEGSSSNSEPSKLTHPNKNRSKGPKRRLPKGKSMSKAGNSQPKDIPAKNDFAVVNSSLMTAQLQPIYNLETPHEKNLQPVQWRAPPPKGKKPDFKNLATQSTT